MRGKGKNNKVSRFDRNKILGPMTDFNRVQDPKEAAELGIIATFENNKYGVFLKQSQSLGFSVPGPDGRQMPMEILHVIIVRHDKKKTEIPWEEKQAIKDAILGENVECMELFPGERRRMRKIVDHQTHLWAFPPGSMIPAGLIPKGMQAMAQRHALDNFEIAEEDLELYAVEDNGILQFFASKDDAAKSYDKVGNEMPEGAVVYVGDVSEESSQVGWSEATKVKVASVLEKSATLDSLTNSRSEPVDSEETKVDTNGPETDQDELEAAHGIGDSAPKGDEENVMMPEYMELGVKQMRDDRVRAISRAAMKLTEWMAAKEVKAAQEAKDEVEAESDLQTMREQARKDRSRDDGAKESVEN